MSRESLAQAVKDAMEAAGVSVRKLAEITATSPFYIAQLRKGIPGTVENLGTVSRALGLAPGDLVNIYMDFNPNPDETASTIKEFLLLSPHDQKLITELIRRLRT